jgi:hypothetical protein
MGKDTKTIAAAHERHVAVHDLGHERQDIGLDPRLDRGFLFRWIGHTARAATHDHACVVLQRQGRQTRLVEPDARRLRLGQPATGEKGVELIICGLILGAQLQDQKGLHAAASATAKSFSIRALGRPIQRRLTT